MEQMIKPKIQAKIEHDAQRFISDVSQTEDKKESDGEKLSLLSSTERDAPKSQTSRSPFKVIIEDVDKKGKSQTPKFGRRRPPQEEDIIIKTTIVEGNPKYNEYTKNYCKQTTNTYQEAVQNRMHKEMRQRSPSTSEERERAVSIKFQKESFTSSSDARESSEEPFQLLTSYEHLSSPKKESFVKRTYPIAGCSESKHNNLNINNSTLRYQKRHFDENHNCNRFKGENGWMDGRWYDVKF